MLNEGEARAQYSHILDLQESCSHPSDVFPWFSIEQALDGRDSSCQIPPPVLSTPQTQRSAENGLVHENRVFPKKVVSEAAVRASLAAPEAACIKVTPQSH